MDRAAADRPRPGGPPEALGGERGAHWSEGNSVVGRDRGIEVDNLVREFKKGPRAVDGIDIRVEPGEVYGFLGPNGAGKTTTVRMLVTLLRPTGGRAAVAGFDVATQAAEVRSRIGVA